MLTLIHAPRSRSTRIIWLLEELGADYDIKVVDIRRGNGTGAPDPDNPHPHKQVPALIHDGHLITESIAVVQYLTDLYPAAGMAPVVGDPLRGEYLTWLAYYAGVVEPAVQAKFAKLTDTVPAMAAQHDAMVERLVTTLAAQPFLLGDTFSAADLIFISMLQFARSLLPPGDVIDAYAARGDRPALHRAMAKDGG